jgi:inorganic pyrophosphatase
MARPDGLHALSPFDATGEHVIVVVETPGGSRAKLRWDPDRGVFELAKYLPLGFAFPCDFGFVPGTCAGDGDPIDVVLVGDAPTAPGCVVPARLVGVIEAEQTVDGRTERNDRLVAVPVASRDRAEVTRLDHLGASLLGELESFLAAYQSLDRKAFSVRGHAGPERALTLLEAAMREAAER